MDGRKSITKENVNVRLPEGLHLRVKAAAPARCGTVERAYEEALTEWLARAAGIQANAQTSPDSPALRNAVQTAIRHLDSARQALLDVENVKAPPGRKVPTHQSDPAKQARRVLGRAQERGSGTEGL